MGGSGVGVGAWLRRIPPSSSSRRNWRMPGRTHDVPATWSPRWSPRSNSCGSFCLRRLLRTATVLAHQRREHWRSQDKQIMTRCWRTWPMLDGSSRCPRSMPLHGWTVMPQTPCHARTAPSALASQRLLLHLLRLLLLRLPLRCQTYSCRASVTQMKQEATTKATALSWHCQQRGSAPCKPSRPACVWASIRVVQDTSLQCVSPMTLNTPGWLAICPSNAVVLSIAASCITGSAPLCLQASTTSIWVRGFGGGSG